MRSSLTNRVSKMCSSVLLFTMLITMVFGSNPVSAGTVKAEGINLVKNPGFEDGTEKPDYRAARAEAWENKMEFSITDKTYSFKKLGLYDKTANPPGNQPTQEGWNIKDATCDYLAQPFGITVQAERLNAQINIEFDVPQTGYYLVKFTGTRSRSGGVGSIIVDGIKVGEFNFSADAQSDGIVKDVGYARLDQGKHILTLKATGKGEYGNKWYYLYPTQFDLEKVLDFQLSAGKDELLIGQSTALKLTATIDESTILDVAQTGTDVSYGSSDECIVRVNDSGVVTPVAAGIATVTASAVIVNASLEKSMQITVSSDTLAAVSLETANAKIPCGSSALLTVGGLSSGGKTVDLTGDNVVFSSGDTEILTVEQNGMVNALKAGKTTVSAAVTIGGVTKTGEIEIEVMESTLDSISLSAVQSILPLGRTSQLKLTAVATSGKEVNLTGAAINYTSSDENVATVNEGGLVSLVGVGTATITVDVVSGEIERQASVGIEVQDPGDTVNSKTRATYYTDAKVAAARENVNEYDWAKALRDNAVLEADKYVALGDEFLWNMVTPQSIPRSIFHMQRTKASAVGCPVCGTAINNYGSYPWLLDPVNNPWKLVCPNCKTIFPTNDFEAYYESGLDEHGIFNRELADRSLLVNTLYPEKGETWGVDDGYGWMDSNGNVFTFIAFYNNWALWYGEQGQNGIIQKALESLRDAYIFTGDLKYAHAGIILLDRIADVYPDMDVSQYLWADGFDNGEPDYHTCQGKILNDIWETYLATDFASSYDAFFPALKDGDAANVVPFLAEKSDRYGLGMLKYSANGIKKNIEDNILRQVLPGVQNSQIRGNQGMHQASLAMAAVVLDEEGTTKQMLDFDFQAGGLGKVSGSQYPNGRKYIVTGGNILGVLTNDVDRDGSGNESAPGYNQIWLDQMALVADVLDGYDRYPEDDMYKSEEVGAKFMKMFKAQYPLIMEGKYMPSIGDSGGTGLAGISLSVDTFVKAFEKFGGPEFAQVAYMLNNKSVWGIHSSIFTKDPEQVARDIKNVIDTSGQLNPSSQNLTGYGFAVLRDGADYAKTAGIVYDFLQMSITGSSGKEHKQVSGPALFYRSAAPGDYISFGFSVPETGEYDITLLTMLANLYGQYIVKIDGTAVGQIYDGYFSVTKAGDPTSFGTVALTAGNHEITFECAGKNDASSNYVIGLMKLTLTNVIDMPAPGSNVKKNTQRDVWVYYGRNTGHGHKDTLNLGIHAFGLDLAPDLGYPDYTGADSKRLQWISNTISHNTVVVDKAKQQDEWVGTPSHFDENNMVSLVDVSAPDVYPQTDMYRRTTAMIKADDGNSYSVDFFRVEGGNDHHFSFHSNAATVTTEGLNLDAQVDSSGNYVGTYAGPEVPFMQVPAGENASGSDYTGPGFHYLRNVQKDENPSENFSVDWNQKNDTDVHLRLTMLGEYNDAALTIGEPPLNNASNPRELNYLVVHRQGTDIDSLFTSVIEPYKGERYIQSISEASLTANGQPVTGDVNVRAVKVVLVNGRTDYIINSINPDVTYNVDGKFQFKGFFGVYSERGGIPFYTYVNDGKFAGILVENATAGYTGSVVDFTRDMSTDNEITVDLESAGFDAQELAGRFIYVENDGVRNAAYQIMGVKNVSGNRVTLDIGDATTVRSWKDNSDYTKGYIYDMAPGQRFTIPLSAEKLSPLGTALLTADETTLLKDQQSGLTVSAAYESGAPVDMNEAITEYVSTDADVVSVKDGVMSAINPGSAEVYAKVTLNGVTVQSNTVIVNVTATIEQETERISGETSTRNTYYATILGSGIKLRVNVDPAAGKATVNVDTNIMSGGKSQVVDVPAIPGVGSYTLAIPADYLSDSTGDGSLVFQTPVGSVTLASDMLAGTPEAEGRKAQITIAEGDKTALPDDVKAAIGDRPLIDISLSLDGVQTDWNNPGSPVTVTIPYTPTEAERANPESIVVWYIDGSGNLVCIPNGRYDAETGTVKFDITHFSNYAVTFNAVSFDDVPEEAWYSKAVSFIAARGITDGTGSGKYSPGAKLTRGEFIVLMMRAYGIAPDENPADNFADSGDTWYTNYLAAAKRLGISSGVGNNLYAPGGEITRQEMFTLLYNALKVIGRLPGGLGEQRPEDAASQDAGASSGQSLRPASQGDSGKTLADFTDAGQIAPWAKDAMTLLVRTGIVVGSNGALTPLGTATRAEMAQVLYNLLQK